MSSSAKSKLLTQLKGLGLLPDDLLTSRQAIKAEKEALSSTRTPFGPLLVTREFSLIDTDDLAKFPIQNPLAMLHVALGTSPRFSKYARDAVAVHGLPTYNDPWGLVLYFDEVTCGNPLTLGAKRKIQGIYWSIYELGPQALSDETAWFELACFQDSKVSGFEGKMSHNVEQALMCFFDDAGHDLRTGLRFDMLHHGTFCLFMSMEIMIADIKALVEVVASNGPTSTLPCLSCDHVVSYAAKRKPELATNGDFVTLACRDHAKYGKRSNASIKAMLQQLADAHARVQAGTMTQAAFADKQKWNGYKHIPNNVILNQRLNIDVVHSLVYDWMHLMFQTGNWNREFWRLLKLCVRAGIPAYTECGEYMRTWMWPLSCSKIRGSFGTRIFTQQHFDSCNSKDAGYFKCGASEGLSMYAIGAKFFGDVVLPVARACGNTLIMSAIHSYLKLCDVIDQLARNHYGLYVSPVVLQEKATAWANSLFDTYGQTMFWPKTHKTFAHLADQLQRRKGHAYKAAHLPSCWAQDDTYVINVQLTIIAQRL
jgi:hypothetical protein